MRSQPFRNGSCGIGLGFPTLNRLAWVLAAKLASNFLDRYAISKDTLKQWVLWDLNRMLWEF